MFNASQVDKPSHAQRGTTGTMQPKVDQEVALQGGYKRRLI
jgi:hypothetical protein